MIGRSAAFIGQLLEVVAVDGSSSCIRVHVDDAKSMTHLLR
jgi:hypothetical protein